MIKNRKYLLVALGAVLTALTAWLLSTVVLAADKPAAVLSVASTATSSMLAAPEPRVEECDVLTAAWNELASKVSEESYSTDVSALGSFGDRISSWYGDPKANLIGQDLVKVLASMVNQDPTVFASNMADLTRDYRLAVQGC